MEEEVEEEAGCEGVLGKDKAVRILLSLMFVLDDGWSGYGVSVMTSISLPFLVYPLAIFIIPNSR